MPAPTTRPHLPTAQDLSDAEFAELDEALLQTPEPLEPVDAVMLDGYLCGVLVQPVLLSPGEWLPPIFDFDARPLPDSVDAGWRQRVCDLVLRRHAALNRAMAEDGWFNPLILEIDEDAEAADASEAASTSAASKPPATSAEDDTSPAAGTETTLASDDGPDLMAGLSPISQALMPWVAGFQHAVQTFPALADLPDDAVSVALARLYRHLPAETPQERELVDTLDREQPLATLDDAIEELVVTVADLWDLTEEARYKVETVRHDVPKPGRNDPCHCGSGKKYKHCHGA